MKTKKYLEQIIDLKTTIDILENEIKEIRERFYSAGSGTRNEGIAAPRSNTSKTERAAIIISEKEEQLEKIKQRYLRTRDATVNKIYMIEDWRYRKIIYSKYVEGKKLYEISKIIGYSYDTIRHMHRKAITAFEKVSTQKHNNM